MPEIVQELVEQQVVNAAGCVVADSEGKGRGVFATNPIPAHTLIEISPVLLFEKGEYEAHAKHTIVDHYTFKWPGGRMALALGLGSIFNHSNQPNVNYTLDPASDSIRYTTSHNIAPGEELFIFYGHNLWFEPTEDSKAANSKPIEAEDPFEDMDLSIIEINPFLDGTVTETISEDELPFKRVKVVVNDDEEDNDTIRTMSVWVVDIPNHRLITDLLKWIKSSGLETPGLCHLKRVRRSRNKQPTLLLLECTGTDQTPPTTPPSFDLPTPYQISVPASVAITPISLELKTAMWPIVYAPRRKGEPDKWTRGMARWAWNIVEALVEEAEVAKNDGQLPMVSYVVEPYSNVLDSQDHQPSPAIKFSARDNRTVHPLDHSVVGVIRVAAGRQSGVLDQSINNSSSPSPSKPEPESGAQANCGEGLPRSGYLLTSHVLFTTHEPCLMCSMSLLHSRVKEIVYLVPMDLTGGCGGKDGSGICVPRLQGVNHRYGIMQWTTTERQQEALQVDPELDA